MICLTPNSRESQQTRLESKTQDRQLVNRVVEGTGMSPWEAEILVDVVQEVYFDELENTLLCPGQLRYEYVTRNEGVGKSLRNCQLIENQGLGWNGARFYWVKGIRCEGEEGRKPVAEADWKG